MRDIAKRHLAAPVLATLAALCLLAPASATAFEETETHIFDATLSLTGNCATNALDPVPDPGLCPGVAGVDHPSKRFKVPRGPAIDQYGNVYLASSPIVGGDAEALIDVFDSSGYFITEIADGKGVQALAVDSEGHLYAYQSESGGVNRVVRYDPTVYEPEAGNIEYGSAPVSVIAGGAEPTFTLDYGSNIGLAIDASNDHLFIQASSKAFELGSAAEGNPLIDAHVGGEIRERYRERIRTFDSEGNLAHQEEVEGPVDTGPVKNRPPTEIVWDGEGHRVEETVVSEIGPVVREGELVKARWIAVDASSHDIYVSTGVESGAEGPLAEPAVVRVFDGEDPGHPLIRTIDGSCLPEGHFGANGASSVSVALDESNGHVFVDDRASSNFSARNVYEFTETGECVSTIEHSFEYAFVSEIAIDNGAHSPNGALNPDGRYLFVPSGEVGTKSHLYAFGPVPKAAYPLRVAKTGEGAGKVTSEPAGIDCGESCEDEFEAGSEVTLQAESEEGSEFTAWEGCDTEAEGKCTVVIDKAREVTATFEPEEEVGPAGPPLTLNIEEGTGTVVSNPAGLECSGAAVKSCVTEGVEEGTVVLTASPAAGYTFKSWKYCDKGGVSGRRCTINLNEAKTIGAKFVKTYELDFDRVGSGLGKVSSTPGGLLCLGNCSGATAAVIGETAITLKATPAKHFVLAEWTGDCSGSELTCPLGSIEADAEVGARFTEVAKHDLTLTKSGGGNGTVKGEPAGINCGVICPVQSASHYQGEEVELTATPGKGSSFGGWSKTAGTCAGTTNPCKVTISAATEVQAEFK